MTEKEGKTVKMQLNSNHPETGDHSKWMVDRNHKQMLYEKGGEEKKNKKFWYYNPITFEIKEVLVLQSQNF